MHIQEIASSEQFKEIIKKGIILIDFNAPWCAPCRAQEPIIERVAEQFDKKALFAKMNIDNHQETAIKLEIKSIPTLTVFKDGKEVQRFIGLQSEQTLSGAIKKLMN
jgi:thioredoxin 1